MMEFINFEAEVDDDISENESIVSDNDIIDD